MGNAGMKGKGRKHLPKVGTRAENNYSIRHERAAVEENLGLRPGGTAVKIIAVVLFVVAVVAIVGLIVLN